MLNPSKSSVGERAGASKHLAEPRWAELEDSSGFLQPFVGFVGFYKEERAAGKPVTSGAVWAQHQNAPLCAELSGTDWFCRDRREYNDGHEEIS